jgi:hypothetical protein
MAIINPITADRGLDPGAAPSTARDNSVPRGLERLGSAIGQAADVQKRLQEINERRQRFTAELLWHRTQQELDAVRAEALIDIVPGAGDFAAGLSQAMDERYIAFLDTLPTEHQARFTERVSADREVRLRQAAADEVRERALWYERGIASVVSAAAEEVAVDPTRLEDKRRAIDELTGEADLPEARLAELRREADVVLAAAVAAYGSR